MTVGCVTMAAPPPVATFGGPRVALSGHSEAGVGVGSGMSLFPGAHSGGSGWLGRWRQGLGGGFDYASLRLAGANGYPGGAFGTGTTVPPADLLLVRAMGADGRISGSSRFVAELGIGPALVQGCGDVGVVFYFGAGVLFDIGGAR